MLAASFSASTPCGRGTSNGTRASACGVNQFMQRRRRSNVESSRPIDAAIDDDRLTGEVTGLQRAEVGAEIADFVRPSHAAHRDGLGEALELLVGRNARSLRPSGKDLGETIGKDGTGRDVVDGDAVRCEV